MGQAETTIRTMATNDEKVAAETEGKGLRAHRLQLLGERCLEIVVISKGSGSGGGAGKISPVWGCAFHEGFHETKRRN